MGNYMSCRCSCVCLKASAGAGLAEESKNKLQSMIMVVHSAEKRVIEVGGGAPMKVAELMLEFPGHFVSECETDNQDNLHMKRAAPLPADYEALPGRVYILFPMQKLHTRVPPHESSCYLSLLNTHVVSSLSSSSKKKKQYNGSKVTPLNMQNLPPSTPPNMHNLLPSTPSQEKEENIPFLDCPSDDEIDAFLQQFCSSHQQKPSSIFSNNPNSTRTLVRSKSWIPKLETISESSILSA